MSLAVSGRYEIAAADVRVYDAFHMFYIKKKIKNSANVYVLPQCYLMPINITKKTRDFVTDSDVYHADIRGDDSSEVYQVREYRPGDSVRNIHWKLTARQDEIMVRDMNKTLSCPVIICVNLNGKDCKNYGHAMSAALESMVSLSFSLIDIRVPHFIAWYDPEKMSITRYRIIKEEDVYDAAARMSYVDARSMDWYDVIGMYREKYRGEDFTSFIDVDMKGNIQCGDDRYHVKFETLKEDITHICLGEVTDVVADRGADLKIILGLAVWMLSSGIAYLVGDIAFSSDIYKYMEPANLMMLCVIGGLVIAAVYSCWYGDLPEERCFTPAEEV